MVDSIELLASFHKSPILGPTPYRNPTRKPVMVLGFSDCRRSSRRKHQNHGLCCKAMESSKSVDGEMFSLTSSSKSDVDYLGESTKGDLNVRKEHLEAFATDGQSTLDGPIEEIAKISTREAETLLNQLGIAEHYKPERFICYARQNEFSPPEVQS